MVSNKNILVIVVLIATAIAVVMLCRRKQTKEGWWGGIPARTIKVIPEMVNSNGQMTSLSDQMSGQSVVANNRINFISTPSFQSLLAPRFNSVGYRPFISYSLAPYSQQGVPCNPLGYKDVATPTKESFTNIKCGQCGGQCGASVCNQSGMYNANIAQVGVNNVKSTLNYETQLGESSMANINLNMDDTLPVGTMTGVEGEPIVYDRFIFAQKRSRTVKDADFIRGDLAIQPEATGWFRPSVNVLTDLRQGAMNVIGGYNNDTSKDLAGLISTASAGTMNIIGGVDLTTELSNTGQDVSVTAFP